jgi:hypothetical protein
MKKKVARFIITALFFLGLAIVQRSFVLALPQPFFSISLPLLALVSLLMFLSWDQAWPHLLILGACLDILSFNNFGIQIFSLILSFVAGEFLLKHWLTNRSLYSFSVLAVLVSLSYHLIIITSGFFLGYPGQSFSLLWHDSFWLSWVYETAFGLAGVALVFYVSNSFSHKMKPFFVGK